MLTPYSARVARFTIYTGVLKLLSEQFVGCAQEQPLRGLVEETRRHAAKTLGTVPWKLDEPIWTVGSKLCSGRKCGARARINAAASEKARSNISSFCQF